MVANDPEASKEIVVVLQAGVLMMFGLWAAADGVVCALLRRRAFELWESETRQFSAEDAVKYGPDFRKTWRRHFLWRSIQAAALLAIAATWIIVMR